MSYVNTQYWQGLHRRHYGRLTAVGHPGLSETLNALKYASEADSVVRALGYIMPALAAKRPLRILDVGAGTGHWMALIDEFLAQSCGAAVSAGRAGETPAPQAGVQWCAIDISQEALECIRQRMPGAITLQEDLKLVDPHSQAGQWDLVYSFYCLHHLPRLREFLNGLRFAAKSVAQDGFLMLMDPVLTLPYSTFDAFDFRTHRGNGVVRHLHVLDDVLDDEGLRRIALRPAVSFLLNGNIEARRAWSFRLSAGLWKLLQFWCRAEARTRPVAPLLRWADRFCKRRNWGFSSSLCVYRKD